MARGTKQEDLTAWGNQVTHHPMGESQASDQLCDALNCEQPEAKGVTSISFSSHQQIALNKSYLI